jgi:uncharacterized membrane protein
VQNIVTFVSRKLFFNSILRAILETYLKFSISTFISIQTLKIDSREDIINSWMTVLFLVGVISFPVFTFFFLRSRRDRLNEEDFKGRFETLYLNVNTGDDTSVLMMTLFIFRRLL